MIHVGSDHVRVAGDAQPRPPRHAPGWISTILGLAGPGGRRPSAPWRLEAGCTRALACSLIAIALSGCGYTSVHANAPTQMVLSVEPAPPGIPDPGAAEACVLGARAALDAEGALGGEEAPRLVVRIVRLEETTTGTLLRADRLVGRGSRLVLFGEATLVRRAGEKAETFTARTAEAIADRADAADELRSRDDAVRELARNLGRELALRALGRGDAGTSRDAGGMWYGLAP